ncbi:MAG: endonuclease III [Anaerolineales bacterium]
MPPDALTVHNRLLEFYGYPAWRNPLPPLDELVCTILSQNTNDVNRDKAFERLKALYPSWEAVRDAPQDEIIAAVRIAGLANQKGPRIQNVLRTISTERGSLNLDFLKDWPPQQVQAWLTRFPGVGPKTAAIVMCFSLDMPAFPVDTHIYRISGRLGLRPERLSVEAAHDHLGALFPPETCYPAHLNLIRLGREICKARRPACGRCPLRSLCPSAARFEEKETSHD